MDDFARAFQKPSGVWAVAFVDSRGKRRRITTGIKTPKTARDKTRRRPPPEVRARILTIVREHWRGGGRPLKTDAVS